MHLASVLAQRSLRLAGLPTHRLHELAVLVPVASAILLYHLRTGDAEIDGPTLPRSAMRCRLRYVGAIAARLGTILDVVVASIRFVADCLVRCGTVDQQVLAD